MHTVTCKLNKEARLHPVENGTIFFLSLGEKHYNRKTKQTGFTNYEAAVYAKANQVDYYTKNLVAGAVVTVSGINIIPEDEGQYGIKLMLQEARLDYCMNPATPMPDSVRQQAPQQAPQQSFQQPQQAPPAQDNFDDDIPF